MTPIDAAVEVTLQKEPCGTTSFTATTTIQITPHYHSSRIWSLSSRTCDGEPIPTASSMNSVAPEGFSRFKETILNQTTPMAFTLMKEDNLSIQVVHLVEKFGGDPSNPAKYQCHIIGFVGI